MKTEAKQLRDKVAKLEKEFTEAKKDLEQLVGTCQHQFGETLYDPIETPAYTYPGDPPGTMGVDWRGPCHVPAQTEKQWKRICELCGEVEYTKRVKQKTEEEPDWPQGRYTR
jgi:hypothetical protein